MDPLTAFSLASGVIQIVDFSIRGLSKCKEIYDHGSISDYHDIDEIANHLTDLRQDLRLPSSREIEIPSDKGLIDLATKCSATAAQLITKLQALKIDGPRKKRDALKKTVKYIREKKSIQDIQKRLDSYRNALDTHILINLRQRYDMSSLQQTQGFQSLNQQVRNLVTSLSQGEKHFEELKIALRNETKQTRDHIDKAFQQQQVQQKKERYREQLLDSLWFTEINSREERIADAHRETFEWIFDESGQAISPWDNFVQWLQSGRDAYWINGKAGSGKSTLMSFLCQDDRTKESLRVWSGGKKFLMPKFFFWSGGTALEKSIEGLLRSLIWQILNDLPDLDIGFSQTIAAWTERRLRTMLQKIVQLAIISHPLCFFIDGLDEFGGEQDELVSFIQEAVEGTDVKVCLSSRPYRVFEKAFGSSAKLRLQDLTRKDIQKFVVDKFQGMKQASAITLEDPLWLEEITKKILWRAQGVFLWVSLAVRDQMRGLRNGDSPAQLEERLGSLPNEIEGVYAHMLSQIEKYYRGEASQLFQVALYAAQYHTDCTLLGFALAVRERLDHILASPDSIPELELITISQSIGERIVIMCAGLLEIHDDANTEEDDDDADADEDDDDADAEEDDDVNAKEDGLFHCSYRHDLALDTGGEVTKDQLLSLDSHITVDFVHRTAIDFLQDPRQGGAFLKAHSPTDFDPQISYVKVSLAKLRLFGAQRSEYLDRVMTQMCIAEHNTGVAQEQLCELIDDVMSKVDHTHPKWRPDSHWCTHWGDISSYLRPSYSDPDRPRTRPYYADILGGGPDFVAYAAWKGLSRYVQQVLYSQKVPLGKGAANWLLQCSLFSLGSGLQVVERYMAGLILAGESLRQGADPNVGEGFNSATNHTVWMKFLQQMPDYSPPDPNRRPSHFSEADLAESRKILLQTTLSFVEYGADLHILQTINVDPTQEYPTKKSREYRLKVELSPLAIIELCLNGQHEFTQVRDIFVTNGARSCLRCTRINFINYVGNELQGSRIFELSGQESAAFIRLFEKDLTSRAAWQHFEHQSSKLADEIYQDRVKSSGEIRTQ